MTSHTRISRRDFLGSTAGLTLALTIAPECVIGLEEARADTPLSPNAWLTIMPDGSHPLQKAWIAEQVPQCGYCQSGQIMQAADLLARNKTPSRVEIVEHMDGNICRCGTYLKIISAIQRASREG